MVAKAWQHLLAAAAKICCDINLLGTCLHYLAYLGGQDIGWPDLTSRQLHSLNITESTKSSGRLANVLCNMVINDKQIYCACTRNCLK